MSAPRGGHPSDRSLGVEPRSSLSALKDVTRGDRVPSVTDPSQIPPPPKARLMGGR